MPSNNEAALLSSDAPYLRQWPVLVEPERAHVAPHYGIRTPPYTHNYPVPLAVNHI